MDTPKSSRRKTGRAGHHRLGFDHFSVDILQLKLDTSLIDCLISWCVLTIEDAETIRQTQGQTNRNKLLLNVLKERPYNTFSSFTEALKTTDSIYNDLVNAMKTFEIKNEQPNVKFSDESIEIHDFSVRFQKKYKTLVDQVTSPTKIVDILLESGAFNIEDYEDINSLTTVFQKNRMLLSKVARKGRCGYEKFLRALKTSDDFRDQELALEVESTEISQDDKLLLQIGITLSQENKNIPSNIRGIAKKFEDCWIEEDAVFVETESTSKVFNTIKETNFITIVGSSGSGKTAVMRHVVLKLRSKERFQVIPVDSPDKIIEYGDSNTKQVFLIDDVLGTYAVNQILVEKWERLDSQIQHCLNKNPGNMKLLFTLRKQVVNNKKFSNCCSIITQNIVDLEDDQIALSKEEKKLILTKHLKIKDVEGDITEKDVEEACALDYAFPLLCRIVSSNDERRKNIAKFFREPFSVLEEELNKLWTENKEVYCSLVFCMLLNGKIGKDFFDVNLQKHEKFSIVAEACGLDSNVSRKVLEDSLASVVGTYVNCENGLFYFMHDAFLEFISSNFSKMNPNVMFSCCNIDLICDRVRVNSRLPDDDENIIVISQDQFEVIAERILTECVEGRFSNVLRSQVIRNEHFVDFFGTQLKNKKETAFNKLMIKVSKERRNNKLKDLILEMWRSFKLTDDNKNKIDENNAAIKEVIRAPSRQSTFIHWILAFSCHRLFNYFWRNASKMEQKNLLSRDLIFPLTKPFFPLAVLGGNIDIIRTLHSSGADVNCFSYEGETPLSITAKCGRDDVADVLVDWGADVNQPDMFSHRFPSFICVENENVQVLKVLLNNNCDVNLVDIYGRSSTMLQALLTRKRNIVNLLLEFDSKNHPLHAAILSCDINSLKTFLENEDINSQTRNGLTPLHYATQVNGTIMIKSLLGDHDDLITDPEDPTKQIEVGSSQDTPLLHSMVANINSKNKNGLAPLHLAVLNDHIEAVKLIVKRNADVNAKDQFGRIPLHYSQISAISSLLLNREISRSTVLYSPPSCSVVPGNQSDVVVVDIDGDQEEHQQTSSCCTLFRNVAWFFLPFKRCIYRGNVNQPDNQGNTPLHVVVETSHDLHPSIKENVDSAGNIKFLIKHGANIHLRNNEGYLPSDLVRERNDLQDLFTSYTSEINRNSDIRKVSFLFSLLLCYAIGISPLAWALSIIQDRFNSLEDSFNVNQTIIDVLKRLQQRADDLIMYYVFLIGVMLYIMTCLMIIRVVIQLRKLSCRYCIACVTLLFMMQFSAMTLFVVYDKTFTFIRFIYVIFVSGLTGCHLVFATNIKELLSLKMKRLQTILLFFVFNYVSLSVLFSIGAISVFVGAHLNNETTSTLNKTFCDIIQNGSLIKQVYDVKDTTRFTPSTSIDCTEIFSVQEQDLASFYCSLVNLLFISIGLYIFLIVCEKSLIPPPKNRIENKIIRNYCEKILTMITFNLFGLLLIMITYLVKMIRILNAIYNS